MRKTVLGWMIAVLLGTVSGAFSAETGIDGVAPGRWTMDLDAARKMATEKKMPILLDFSGSDWCGWCKLMEKNVFTQQDWKDYAKDNIMMVLIDFPKEAGIVPEKYVQRNNELKEKFGIEGFPTFVVLDDDGETVLGRLGAGQDKTPESFIAELQGLFRNRPAEIAKLTKAFSAADKEAYLKIVSQITDCGKSIKEQKQQIDGAQKKILDLQKKAVELQEAAMDFRASKLAPAKQAEYKELKAKMDSARKKLAEWLATKPQRNEENGQKFKTLTTELKDLEGKLSGY